MTFFKLEIMKAQKSNFWWTLYSPFKLNRIIFCEEKSAKPRRGLSMSGRWWACSLRCELSMIKPSCSVIQAPVHHFHLEMAQPAQMESARTNITINDRNWMQSVKKYFYIGNIPTSDPLLTAVKLIAYASEVNSFSYFVQYLRPFSFDQPSKDTFNMTWKDSRLRSSL